MNKCKIGIFVFFIINNNGWMRINILRLLHAYLSTQIFLRNDEKR